MNEWDLGGSSDLRLRVCEWTCPGSGHRPVILLHGFLEQGASWDPVARLLGRRVIAPDQRGFGRSAHIGRGCWYHFWDYIGDLDRLVDHIGSPVDLVGHSMGGTVASLYAGVCPDKVRRLVLVEGLGPPDGRADALSRSRAFIRHRATLPRHPLLADVEEAMQRMRRWNPMLAEPLARRLAQRVTRPVRPDDGLGPGSPQGALTWTWDPRHRGRSPQPFDSDLYKSTISKITAKTMHIAGEDSPFRFPDQALRLACIPNVVSCEIPGAGHMLHFDTPIRLADAIRGHLDGS